MVHVFCNLDDEEDGLPPMCDMTFEIVEKQYDELSSSWRLAFRADAAPYDPVGFGAIVPVVGWHEQVVGEGDEAFHSFWGAVSIHTSGPESDRLVALLADYYGLSANRIGEGSPASLKFTDNIECLAVGIASNPAAIADEVVRMKLFFDEGVENGRYAEVFFDVDLADGFAKLNEKDEDYRADLVYWLSLPGKVNGNPYAA
ncbi:hypothetical protein [Novosphingobium sp.]|uniref:hypothetical protein n=1 Tax=Novosphingobium sp. TaxID=1874826 RepID=UPI002FD909B9